ncbi:MAG: hypothetical protein C4293_20145 [Nitrospiraceae bacterium]
MRIAFVYEHALCKGGYPRDVRWLAGALVSQGVDVILFAAEGKETEGLDSRVTVKPLELVGNRMPADIYHIFGIFLPRQMRLLSQLLRRDTLVVLSPMGHLMPFHLKTNGAKKYLFLHVMKILLLDLHFIHVFSETERDSIIRYWHGGVRSFEAGLGLFPAPFAPAPPRGAKNSLSLLFFGRNDVYQKGIDILLEGVAKAVDRGVPLQLTIAGQPWGSSERFIRDYINRRRLGEHARLLGPVDESVKWQLLREADYLTFLSRWDGPPRPIREAIAVGTPVLVSPETNMGQLVSKYAAGMQVQLRPEEVAQVLFEIANNTNLQNQHRDGVLQLQNRLDWGRVAQDYIAGYQSMLGNGE